MCTVCVYNLFFSTDEREKDIYIYIIVITMITMLTVMIGED